MVTNMEYLQIVQLPRVSVHVKKLVYRMCILYKQIYCNLSMMILGVKKKRIISSTKGLEKRNLRGRMCVSN